MKIDNAEAYRKFAEGARNERECNECCDGCSDDNEKSYEEKWYDSKNNKEFTEKVVVENRFDEYSYGITDGTNFHKAFKIVYDNDVEFIFIIVPKFDEIHLHLEHKYLSNNEGNDIIAIYDMKNYKIEYDKTFEKILSEDVKNWILFMCKRFKMEFLVPDEAITTDYFA